MTAVVRSTLNAPPEVWAGPTGEWRQLTANNATQTVEWGKAENLEWTTDGHRIQGWLLPPKEVVAGRRYPLIVLIHGGPSGAFSESFIGASGTRSHGICRPA